MKRLLLLKSLFLLCALIVGTSAWADPTTLYSETFGDNGSSNTAFSSYSGYSATTAMFVGSGTVASHYTGSGKVGKNSVSPSDTYTGASGLSAAWYTGAKNTTTDVLIISGIKITGYGDLNLSFGINMTNGAASTNTTTVSYKIDDGEYQNLTFTHPTSSGWNLKSGNISGTGTSLTIKFTMAVTGGFTTRYDDIKLTGTALGGTDPTITFNNGSVRVGNTLDLSTLFTSNSTGTVTYSITSGDSYASITGNILTGVAEGSVTVQASQAASGGYNAGDETATISVTDPALSSIAITTAPTKTTYDEGDLFDATGMVVTATFADASTEDVTASCTSSPSGTLASTDTEVTISYTYKGVTKTATQGITVNAYTQPTEFDIALKNSLFGTSYSGTASGITDDAPVSGTLNHVTVTYAGSGNHYINDSQIRFYPSNKLTFEAPAGYIITKIVFTSGGTWAATITSNNGTYTSDTKTWTGGASSVLFTGSGSSRCDMTKATITLSNSYPVTIASSGYSTLGTTCGLDFANASPAGLEAYVVPSITASAVSLSDIDEAPASTGVILKGTPDETYTIPVKTTASFDGTNKLKSAMTATTLADGSFYIMKGGKFCLVTNTENAAARTVPAGKAYLLATDVPSEARELTFVFDDVTAIETVKSEKTEGQYFNLAGQRVANPTKGLYIVNGKKVIIK